MSVPFDNMSVPFDNTSACHKKKETELRLSHLIMTSPSPLPPEDEDDAHQLE